MSANTETPHRWPPNKPEDGRNCVLPGGREEVHNANVELEPKASEIVQQLMLFEEMLDG
jgi:hypothetical protein